MTLYFESVENCSRHDAQLRVNDSLFENILKNIFRALIYLVNRELIHRDVKLNNIFVESLTFKDPTN